MATQFPSDTSQSPWAGPNGVTYEWNAKGYWEASGDNLSETYLSKTNDDTAAGEITFEGTTTHEAGVEVTGGQGAVSDGLISTGTNNVTLKTAGNNYLHASSTAAAAFDLNIEDGTIGRADGAACYGLQLRNPSTLTTERADQIYTGITSGVDITSSVANAYGFFADCTASTGVTDFAASYLANASQTNPKAFNFYAAGDAPNYFNGDIRVRATVTEPGAGNTSVGTCILNSGINGSTIFASRADNLAMCMNRNGSGIVGQYRISGAVRGEVVVSSGGCNWNSRADFRTRAEVPEFTDAASVISQLKAGRDGFSAEDIQAYMPGDWSYQSEGEVMFDKTRLIPILTKALQEALDRIETLEADVATLQGN